MLESQRNQQRMMPAMGGMYRGQQMFAPPNMYFSFPPSMYPYVQRPNMFPRQTQYQRTFHQRTNQGRRLNNKQVQMQQQQVQMQQQQAQAPVQPTPAAPAPSEAGLDKQALGEAIYARIMPMFPGDQNLWGKLTGMLLESISIQDLQVLVNDPAKLTEKINQAKDYYDQHVEQANAAQ